MQKIILYYKFAPVKDPGMTMRWQKELCERLNLKGRIIVSEHGINGTLGGDLGDLRTYKKEMNKSVVFKDIEYKWSNGTRDDFPRLSIKVRKELVTLDAPEDFDPFDKGTPLRPEAWHKFIEEHPEVPILDGRNEYESNIGRFKGAITPKIHAFKEIKEELDKLPKDKPVLAYCTGDIRCEYLSAYMKHEGFKEVYHLDGGIVKYGEKYGDKGHWEGKCFVFDDRMHLSFSDESQDIGECVHCHEKTSNYENCANMACNNLVLICKDCKKDTSVCSMTCAVVVAETLVS
jgi:UPF0176 protein